jgi:hypothetical protein
MRVIDVLQGPGDVTQGRRTRSTQDAIQVNVAYSYLKKAGSEWIPE